MELIRRGDRGTHVLDVQRRLARLGFEIPADERAGVFGEGTLAAVRRFQETRGLLVDGIVGGDTWTALVEASWVLGDRLLYLRAPHVAGDDVRELQDKLGTFGFDVGRIDGIYGSRTERAVREFQRNYGLPADGVVAARTVRALRGLPFFAGNTPSATVRERETLRARRPGITGLRVVLDPGHGDGDDGFIGVTGAKEAPICFDIARRVEAGLAAAGAQVYLTRHEDNMPSDAERAALANALDADAFVSIHAGGGDGRPPGTAAYFFGHSRYRSEAGAHLAERLLDALTTSGLPSLGTLAKTVTVLRETRMPAVFLEVASLSDPDEERSLREPGFRMTVAARIADAVRSFAEAEVSV